MHRITCVRTCLLVCSLLLFLALLVFAGCRLGVPEHLYWADVNSGNINVYSIDQVTGALTQTATVQTNLNGLFALSSDPEGRYLYASGPKPNATTVSTVAFSIDKLTGNLTPIAGSPFDFGVFFVNTVNSTRFLYASDNITNQIHTIAIDPMTGALTSLAASTPTGGDNPYSPRLDDVHHLLAVGNQSSNNISVFTLDPNTGKPTLVQGAPFPVNSVTETSCPPKGGCGSDVAFVRDNLYYGNAALANTSETGNAIFGYSVANSGALTALSGSPFSDPSFEPQTLAATQDGRNLYVAHAGGGVVGYAVSNTGALTQVPGTPVNGSGYAAIGGRSRFLYVGDTANTNGITGYSIDPINGGLTPITGAAVGLGIQGGQIVIR